MIISDVSLIASIYGGIASDFQKKAPDMTYHSVGKQVLHGPDHVADAVDNGTALMIAEALNATNTAERHPDLFSDRGSLAHAVRQESDEYACSCGARWDVRDGEEHP